jgi:hypothetical protein
MFKVDETRNSLKRAIDSFLGIFRENSFIFVTPDAGNTPQLLHHGFRNGDESYLSFDSDD